MRNTYSRLLLAIGVTALLLGACSKKEEAAAPATEQPAEAAQPPAEKAAEPEAAKPATPPAAEGGDFIKVYGAHEPKTEADPVEIAVQKFTVKSATFDPANIEGGSAEIELDLSSIKSDKDNRDQHLQSPDYLDVPQFGTATIKVSGVKKEGEKDYSAQAEVTAHGLSKTFPVKFTVLETMADGIKIQGEHQFSRLDFGIGKEPDGENEKVAKEVTIKMQLTLKKS